MTKTTTELKPLIVVEDDPGLQSQLKWSFDGYEVHVAGDRNTAINLLRKTNAPVITLDLGLPPDPTNASEGFIALQALIAMEG